MMNKVWKACLYIRLSREDGDKAESDSIANQRALIHDYAKTQQQIQICSERVDDGYSGVSFDRPGFMAMMEDIKAHLYDCIIVKDLSRFGRNWIESGRYIEQIFPYLGVRFIAINDHYDSLIAQNSNDNITLPFKNLINDAYARDISIKIRSQLAIKRKRGDFIGAFAVYGYTKDLDNHNKLLIDDFAAGVVQDIFKWRIDGLSNQGIANRLNELGILSPYEYKRENGMRYSNALKRNPKALWSAVAVGRILANEVYIGVLEQGKRTSKSYKIKERINKPKKQWIRVENSHEPIISHRDFTLVAELLQHDVRIAPGNEELYVFSGISRCAGCGYNMIRKAVPSGNKQYIYYVCGANKSDRTCSPHSINEKVLEDAVLESVKAHIGNVLEFERIIQFIEAHGANQLGIKKLNKQVLVKKQELEKLEARKLRLYQDLQDGIIDREEYVRYRLEFTKLYTCASHALLRLNREIDALLNNRNDKQQWIECFKEHGNIESLSRGVLVNLVDRVFVQEKDQIEIRFRYKDLFI